MEETIPAVRDMKSNKINGEMFSFFLSLPSISPLAETNKTKKVHVCVKEPSRDGKNPAPSLVASPSTLARI
jgi:hypothetical protein